MIQDTYVVNIHLVGKKEKLIKLAAVLSIILLAAVKNSRSIDENAPKPINASIERDFARNTYEEFSLHSIVEKSDHLKKKDYEKGKESFTLIKDIPFHKYKAQSSDIVVVERNILAGLSNECLLTCVYREVVSGGAAKKYIMCRDAPLQTKKKMLILPYNTKTRTNHLGRFEFVRKAYSHKSELAKGTESAIAYLRNVFIWMLCKAYIEHAEPMSNEKNKMACFIAFLEQKKLVKKEYLEIIGMKDTFFYDLVGRMEDFPLGENIIRLDILSFLRKETIKKSFKENKTLREMTPENMSTIEYMHGSIDRIISKLIEEGKTKYRSCSLEDLIENVRKDTRMLIDTVCEGKFNYYNPDNVDELQKKLDAIEGFKEESRIVVEVVQSIAQHPSDYMLYEEIEKVIDEAIERRQKKESKKPNKRFIQGHVYLFLRVGTDILQREILEWDRELLRVLTTRLNYDPFDKQLYQVKKDYARMDRNIISEIKGRRKRIYKEFKRISSLQSVYNEKIKTLADKIYLKYRQSVDKNPLEKLIDDKTEKEIISLLSCITVDYSETPRTDSVEENKKEVHTNRHIKIEEKEKEIHSELKAIEEEFLKYSEVDEKDRIARIKEGRKRIYRVDFSEQLSSTRDRNIVDMLKYIRDVLEVFADILVNKRVNYLNPAAVEKAKKMKIEADAKIKERSIKDIREVFEFLLKFEDSKWKLIEMSPSFWNIRQGNPQFYYCEAIREIRGSFNNAPREAISWVDQNDLTSIYTVLQALCSMARNFAVIQSYGEVWENPVFLSIDPIFNMSYKKAGKKVYITYRLDKYYEFYEKEIKLSNVNLEAFKDAETIEDIKKIDGNVKKRYISCNRQ